MIHGQSFVAVWQYFMEERNADDTTEYKQCIKVRISIFVNGVLCKDSITHSQIAFSFLVGSDDN